MSPSRQASRTATAPNSPALSHFAESRSLRYPPSTAIGIDIRFRRGCLPAAARTSNARPYQAPRSRRPARLARHLTSRPNSPSPPAESLYHVVETLALQCDTAVAIRCDRPAIAASNPSLGLRPRSPGRFRPARPQPAAMPKNGSVSMGADASGVHAAGRFQVMPGTSGGIVCQRQAYTGKIVLAHRDDELDRAGQVPALALSVVPMRRRPTDAVLAHRRSTRNSARNHPVSRA
jgi:hypothetical protein